MSGIDLFYRIPLVVLIILFFIFVPRVRGHRGNSRTFFLILNIAVSGTYLRVLLTGPFYWLIYRLPPSVVSFLVTMLPAISGHSLRPGTNYKKQQGKNREVAAMYAPGTCLWYV